jgi:hypothetical protein
MRKKREKKSHLSRTIFIVVVVVVVARFACSYMFVIIMIINRFPIKIVVILESAHQAEVSVRFLVASCVFFSCSLSLLFLSASHTCIFVSGLQQDAIFQSFCLTLASIRDDGKRKNLKFSYIGFYLVFVLPSDNPVVCGVVCAFSLCYASIIYVFLNALLVAFVASKMQWQRSI